MGGPVLCARPEEAEQLTDKAFAVMPRVKMESGKTGELSSLVEAAQFRAPSRDTLRRISVWCRI
jgi:hypothetical protein